MICKFCKSRYADYPFCDFYFEEDGVPGIYARSEEAYQRRLVTFRSNEEGSCGCHEYEFMRDRLIQRRRFDVGI